MSEGIQNIAGMYQPWRFCIAEQLNSFFYYYYYHLFVLGLIVLSFIGKSQKWLGRSQWSNTSVTPVEAGEEFGHLFYGQNHEVLHREIRRPQKAYP